MRIWVERLTDYHEWYIRIHWVEPKEYDHKWRRWRSEAEAASWYSKNYKSRLGIRNPRDQELLEVDLGGKPKIVKVWVPA